MLCKRGIYTHKACLLSMRMILQASLLRTLDFLDYLHLLISNQLVCCDYVELENAANCRSFSIAIQCSIDTIDSTHCSPTERPYIAIHSPYKFSGLPPARDGLRSRIARRLW